MYLDSYWHISTQISRIPSLILTHNPAFSKSAQKSQVQTTAIPLGLTEVPSYCTLLVSCCAHLLDSALGFVCFPCSSLDCLLLLCHMLFFIIQSLNFSFIKFIIMIFLLIPYFMLLIWQDNLHFSPMLGHEFFSSKCAFSLGLTTLGLLIPSVSFVLLFYYHLSFGTHTLYSHTPYT